MLNYGYVLETRATGASLACNGSGFWVFRGRPGAWGCREWPSAGAGLELGLVEAGLESGKMGDGLVLGFTGVGLLLGSKVKLGAHLTLLPPCGGDFSLNYTV